MRTAAVVRKEVVTMAAKVVGEACLVDPWEIGSGRNLDERQHGCSCVFLIVPRPPAPLRPLSPAAAPLFCFVGDIPCS